MPVQTARHTTSARHAARVAFRAVPIAAALLLGAATTAAAGGLDRPEPARGPAVTDNVVLVSIDGLRPDAIERFGATTLLRLMREGTFTLEAQTILPSKTLPSHTSMLTGEDVDEHGITWNNNQTGAHGHVEVPTIFDVARKAGLGTAAFFSKTKFEHLQREGSLDYTQAPTNRLWGLLSDKWSVDRTLGDVERYLGANEPHLLFVHLGEPDYAGHRHGWMTKEYGRAVRAADAGVARLLELADARYGAGNYTLLVTADHGGHGKDHGSEDPRDTTIPWITWGRGVQAGVRLEAGLRTFDTASTALWLLGLAEPSDWAGTPVTVAYAAPAPAPTGQATAVAAADDDTERR